MMTMTTIMADMLSQLEDVLEVVELSPTSQLPRRLALSIKAVVIVSV
jgi:hypothetical protein